MMYFDCFLDNTERLLDGLIQRDDEFSDSEDEGEGGRRNEQSRKRPRRQSSRSPETNGHRNTLMASTLNPPNHKSPNFGLSDVNPPAHSRQSSFSSSVATSMTSDHKCRHNAEPERQITEESSDRHGSSHLEVNLQEDLPMLEALSSDLIDSHKQPVSDSVVLDVPMLSRADQLELEQLASGLVDPDPSAPQPTPGLNLATHLQSDMEVDEMVSKPGDLSPQPPENLTTSSQSLGAQMQHLQTSPDHSEPPSSTAQNTEGSSLIPKSDDRTQRIQTARNNLMVAVPLTIQVTERLPPHEVENNETEQIKISNQPSYPTDVLALYSQPMEPSGQVQVQSPCDRMDLDDVRPRKASADLSALNASGQQSSHSHGMEHDEPCNALASVAAAVHCNSTSAPVQPSNVSSIPISPTTSHDAIALATRSSHVSVASLHPQAVPVEPPPTSVHQTQQAARSDTDPKLSISQPTTPPDNSPCHAQQSVTDHREPEQFTDELVGVVKQAAVQVNAEATAVESNLKSETTTDPVPDSSTRISSNIAMMDPQLNSPSLIVDLIRPSTNDHESKTRQGATEIVAACPSAEGPPSKAPSQCENKEKITVNHPSIDPLITASTTSQVSSENS